MRSAALEHQCASAQTWWYHPCLAVALQAQPVRSCTGDFMLPAPASQCLLCKENSGFTGGCGAPGEKKVEPVIYFALQRQRTISCTSVSPDLQTAITLYLQYRVLRDLLPLRMQTKGLPLLFILFWYTLPGNSRVAFLAYRWTPFQCGSLAPCQCLRFSWGDFQASALLLTMDLYKEDVFSWRTTACCW